MKGTPKNLMEAIQNGLEADADSRFEYFEKMTPELSTYNILYAHVKDFLAQKFSAAMIKAELGKFEPKSDLKSLYEQVTKCL